MIGSSAPALVVATREQVPHQHSHQLEHHYVQNTQIKSHLKKYINLYILPVFSSKY